MIQILMSDILGRTHSPLDDSVKGARMSFERVMQ